MKLYRTFPVLTIDDGDAVKTRKFHDPVYIGDPVNTVRLWSEMCVDEIVCLDITEQRRPLSERIETISAIVNEAFVPVSFGGGIDSFDSADRIIGLGIEKVVLGWAGASTRELLDAIASRHGAQAVSCCIDYSGDSSTRRELAKRGKAVVLRAEVSSIVRSLSFGGVGEVILQCVDRDGQFSGYDIELAKSISSESPVPVVLLGGAGSSGDFDSAHKIGCSAAAGSLYVFRGKSSQVLIGNPVFDDRNNG